MTPLERAARALCFDRDPDDKAGGPHPMGTWLDEGEAWWTGYVGSVRAVLQAIREPSEGMVRAGEAWQAHCSDVDTMYSEMILAALEEG